ncbi:MAG: hypothetical protein NWE77_06490 [Candidatus Bathyarchaeota archaeon]|jgi:hypothetical protein|nr:hypothetical protein [Candidatus Bathyarchaeota archaeon]
MTPEDFYPPKCPICYYNNTCNHKSNPSPTRGCYTHKRNCEIWTGDNLTDKLKDELKNPVIWALEKSVS